MCRPIYTHYQACGHLLAQRLPFGCDKVAHCDHHSHYTCEVDAARGPVVQTVERKCKNCRGGEKETKKARKRMVLD
jgi:hypothetical protein